MVTTNLFAEPFFWIAAVAFALLGGGLVALVAASTRRRLNQALAAAETRLKEEAAERERIRREAAARIQALEKEAAKARNELIDSEIVHFLSLLQSRGRFIDFLMDDIAKYDDRLVGAAARVVHEGCSSVLKDFFDIVPVRGDDEGTEITVDREAAADQYRLVGKVSGHPPYQGTLLHRGWRTRRVNLPKLANTSAEETLPREVIAPAEVELR